ncbi:acyl-CoA thioesterase [Haloferula sargassicola]|uniref:1,4-dihydroxy-2-naphthoyl-CoA hydrolase n=1 Tax=Haloferula sargassicola TaxID=490096 RepID=A0ABP9UNE1_9BACT
MPEPACQIRHLVEFHETDMAGIVHFSNFFRYMEKCEHAFARSLAPDLDYLKVGPEATWPRVHASCDFRQPARFGQELVIQQFVTSVRRSSIHYRFEILHESTLLAEGKIVVAHVVRDQGRFTASPLPSPLRAKLEAHCS